MGYTVRKWLALKEKIEVHFGSLQPVVWAMSKSTTPEFVVYLTLDRGVTTPSAWRIKATGCNGCIPGHGKPTADNLKAYVTTFEASTQSGGCNAHLGVTKVLSARIVRQSTRDIVAAYSTPI